VCFDNAKRGYARGVYRGWYVDVSRRVLAITAALALTAATPMPREFIKDLPDKERLWAVMEERHMMKRFGSRTRWSQWRCFWPATNQVS
jgi:hypothetical protein